MVLGTRPVSKPSNNFHEVRGEYVETAMFVISLFSDIITYRQYCQSVFIYTHHN